MKVAKRKTEKTIAMMDKLLFRRAAVVDCFPTRGSVDRKEEYFRREKFILA